MENKTMTITIYAKQVKLDDKKFIASTAKIKDKWYKIKFPMESEKQPKTNGVYDLTFTYDNASIEKGKKYKNKYGEEAVTNDTLWVREITKIRKYTDEELNERNRERMDEVFGE